MHRKLIVRTAYHFPIVTTMFKLLTFVSYVFSSPFGSCRKFLKVAVVIPNVNLQSRLEHLVYIRVLCDTDCVHFTFKGRKTLSVILCSDYKYLNLHCFWILGTFMWLFYEFWPFHWNPTNSDKVRVKWLWNCSHLICSGHGHGE